MTDRFKEIDVCRGLLFLLMINTHALTQASVPRDHWLFSGFWLPNGWATVAFVVLSGYGIGYIFSIREQVAERDAALINRSKKIFAVMFISNFVFSALRQILFDEHIYFLYPMWWTGLFTLNTDWTISGILLPTGLVLLSGPAMIRFCKRALWRTLVVLIVARIAIELLISSLAVTDYANSWILLLLLFKGFGGFPVLPFIINGCLGIWLGVFKRQCGNITWVVVLAGLMLVQLMIYLSSFTPSLLCVQLVSSIGAIAKFAWVFAVALLLTRFQLFPVTSLVGLIGKYSLGSFIMHRVILNAIHFFWYHLGNYRLPPSYYYCLLIIFTIATTWLLCLLRERFPDINRCFTRLAL